MPKIIKLDRKVADLIAAGEVVERPASVVKELVENALDAGAAAISVDISRGGLRSICVTDNGSGIEREDVPTAFLRHATSKVRSAADLADITTMGFRGEALASIAAVSRVELRTKTADELAGFLYRIEGGDEAERGECGMQTGTSITVRDLFFNTPARMKFIKNEAAEAGQVQTVVRSAALARPDVAFTFLKDGVRVFSTQGDGKLAGAVYAVYGREFASGLINVSHELNGIQVRGYISRPAYTQGNRRRQEFYVNRRPINSRLLSAALEDSYRGRMMQGRFPACILHIDLSTDSVDVNVHPAKTEVKFALESAVRDAVHTAVSRALDEGDSRAAIKSRTPAETVEVRHTPPAPTPAPKKPRVPEKVAANDFYAALTAGEYRKLTGRGEVRPAAQKPAQPKQPPVPAAPTAPKPAPRTEAPAQTKPAEAPMRELKTLAPVDRTPAPEVHQQLYIGGALFPTAKPAPKAVEEKPAPAAPVTPAPASEHEAEPETAVQQDERIPWKIIGEAFNTYIIVEQGDELLLIDKHAAHERIRYEELLSRAPGSMSQLLLEPVVFTPEAAERELLLGETELLAEIGFEIDDFGGGSIIVRAAPDEITRDECEAVLDEIAENLAVSRRVPRTEKREAALKLVSCKAALKAGSKTSPAEREVLVARVMEFDDIRYCPHGRPVAVLLPQNEIERRMGRQI